MKIELECGFCKSKFKLEQKDVTQKLKSSKSGKVYCSHKCATLSRRTGKEVTCTHCGCKTYKSKTALSRSKSGKLFCSQACANNFLSQTHCSSNHPNYKNGFSSYRSRALKNQEKRKCDVCHSITWQKKPIPLDIHHIDKDISSNELSNLLVCCPNCHYQLHNK